MSGLLTYSERGWRASSPRVAPSVIARKSGHPREPDHDLVRAMTVVAQRDLTNAERAELALRIGETLPTDDLDGLIERLIDESNRREPDPAREPEDACGAEDDLLGRSAAA